MSGGAYDYAFEKVQDVANRLERQASPLRREFGRHLHKVAEIMKEIEWVDSGDRMHGNEIGMIEELLDVRSAELEIMDLAIEAEKLRRRTEDLIARIEGRKP